MEYAARADYLVSTRLWVLIIVALSLALLTAAQVEAQSSGDFTYIYDELGRLVAVVDPSGDTVRYSYDAVGNLLSISRQNSSIVSIISFTPNSGPVGTSVAIYGTAFSTVASQNAVAFNGVAATVTSASVTQIVATVPVGATSGSITISAPGGSATSATPFTVSGSTAPTISGFSPTMGDPGTAVNITGTNFETVATNNRVTFNGALAAVTSSTATSLIASAPSQPGMGRISVATPFGTAVSADDFFIPSPPYAAADIESTNWIAVGESKTATVTIVGKVSVVFFHGTAGQRMSVKLSGVTNPGFATVFNPDGTELSYAYADTGGGLVELASLPVTGSYAIIISPRDSNNARTTGSMTLTLYNVPSDVTGSITPGGQPVTVTTTVPGQNAVLTFTGNAGQRVSLTMSNVTIPISDVSIVGPDASILAASSVTTSGGSIDTLTLPSAGSYQILVDPRIFHIGSMTLSLNDAPSSPPNITTLAPTIGSAGTTVTITGTNFDPLAANNLVSFNGSSATVGTATSTSIGTSVPTGATSGHITVSTSVGSAVSSDDFFVPPSPYTAADVAFTGRMAFGESKTATIGTANKIGIILFDGASGQRISLSLTNSTMGWVQVTVLNPNGTALIIPTWINGDGFLDTRVLPATDTYAIELDPDSTNTGSVTVQLYDVPADVSGTITPGGSAVTLTTTVPGQNLGLTFSGTAAQRISLQFTSTTAWTRISITNPDGTALISPTWVNGSGFFDSTVLPASGTYTIFADPENANIGSFTFTLYDVPADASATITPGGSAVTLTTTVPGQNLGLTFSGTAAQRISLQFTSTTAWTRVSITNPDGTALISPTWVNGSGFFDTRVLASSGTYTIFADPENANIGSFTFTLYDLPADATGTITSGGPAITVTTTTAGQNARVTFNGNSGDKALLSVSNVTISGTGWSQVSILKPDGTALVAPTWVNGNGRTFDTVTLPATGTYTIVIDPELANTGSVTLVLSNPSVANDNFANAQVISGNSSSAAGSNVGATKEAGEPNHAGSAGGKSIWYRWQAPQGGDVTISTAASSFDTLLAVYTGSTVSSLTTIASNDDASSDHTSRVTFTAVADTVYFIAVDGYNGAAGDVILNWSLANTASVQADYRFQNTRSSSVGSPPALVDLGTNGFTSATVDGTSTTVLAFNQNNGLSLSPTTGLLANDAYSLVVLFSFDQTSSYRRVLDFKHGSSDYGLYVQNGHLYFYPAAYGSPTSIVANTYVQLVLTRDAAGTVTGYVDGTQQFQFSDTYGTAIIDAYNTLRFFRDDGSEASSGSVARIRLYNGALTAEQVTTLDRLPPGP